jgi:TolB-like protein/Flp pilus assembly protein TadD
MTEAVRRRVPQLVGVYLAAAWGLMEFSSWASAQFALEAPWGRIAFGALALGFIPYLLIVWKVGGNGVPGPARASPRSVAVLPFDAVGTDAEAELLGFGIADQILTDLSRVADLQVVARSSSFAFRGRHEDVRTMGRTLGAGAILTGSVQRVGDRLRVMTELVETDAGYQLWSDRYDRTVKDLFAIEDEISANVARVLNVVLREHEKRAMTKVPTEEVKAMEFYLRGRRFLFQTRRRSLEFATEMFERAIQEDPGFALAHAGLADVAALLAMYYPQAGAEMDRAREAAERAMALDPELAEAHAAHGAVLFVSGDIAGAEAAFQRAVDLDPRLFEAHYFHGRLAFQVGRFREAAEHYAQANRVREDYSASFFRAQALEALGVTEEARTAYREALDVAERHLDLNPDDPRAATMRAVSLCRLDREAEGLAWADRALELDPLDPGVRYNAACLFAVAGRRDRALECVEEAVAGGFGNPDWLGHDPDLASLRGDPRFERAMERSAASRDDADGPASRTAEA